MVRIQGTQYAKGPGNNVVKPADPGRAMQKSLATTGKNSPNQVNPLFPGTVHLKQPEIEGHMAAKYEIYYIQPLSLKFPHFYRFWEFPTNPNFVPTN